jgi:hypothetical protein
MKIKNNKIKFSDAGLSFITDIKSKCGDDLIYSLAYENGHIFVCVVAHPSLTTRKFNTENGRILFLISEDEYELPQDELINKLKDKIDYQFKLTEEK